MHSDSLLTIWNFNPRSREGSDFRCSMHRFSCTNFNPRSREGSDMLYWERKGGLHLFQSTLP